MAYPVSRIFRAICVASLLTVPAYSMGTDSLDSVTVEAQRARDKLKHDVNAFVSSAIVQPYNDESLERWTYTKVCPLVAGLNKTQGEFILTRLSEIARTSAVPLGPEKCTPNFYVIVSADPNAILKRVTARPANFNYENGPALNKFLEQPRPIRVWYNVGVTSIDGVALISGLADTSSIHARKFASGAGLDPVQNSMPSFYGSRLNVASVTRDILSVIVVVDSSQVRNLNFGQLADYIGLIGFAQVDLDKDMGDAPTILNLFKGAELHTQGMTNWDKALLHALYSTSHRDKVQLSQIQTAALKEVTASVMSAGTVKQ